MNFHLIIQDVFLALVAQIEQVNIVFTGCKDHVQMISPKVWKWLTPKAKARVLSEP